jgi:hypothetical protein
MGRFQTLRAMGARRAGVVSVVSLAFFAVGCSADAEGASGPPAPPSFTPPSQPPPTGGKWQGVTSENECGRKSFQWVVVDEVCGDVDAPDYLDAFEAPMFRDGALVANLLYTVDAAHLWVLDMSDPSAIRRRALISGIGRPLSVATHAGRLVVAAGGEGLVLLGIEEPFEPRAIARVALSGPALDVHVDGDRAYVATGAAGVAVVDLSVDPPALVRELEVPGFAAGVKTKGNHAYVAACTTFAVVDLTTGRVSGSEWLDTAIQGGVLVAPAKDVEIVGETAYVAAGRYGAVALDVTDPARPGLRGNCTLATDLAFYASGVRAQGDQVFIAGGEWGILPVDAGAQECSLRVEPVVAVPPKPGGGCSSEPPWKVLDWQERWAPPPPPIDQPGVPPRGRDPIQVLPAGDVLYAFGDARRIGLRAVDARDPKSSELFRVGRYDEPHEIVDIDARAGRVLVVGKAGGLFRGDAVGLLLPDADPLPLARNAVAGALTAEGRWVLATEQRELVFEGAAARASTLSRVWPNGIVARGKDVIVPDASGARVLDAAGSAVSSISHARTAELPPSAVAVGDDVVLASPEWVNALSVRASATELPAHGVFDGKQILDASLWQVGLPRRILLANDSDPGAPSLVEVAGLARRAGVFDHRTGTTLSLPEGEYVAGAAAGRRAWLVAADRARYKSQLVAIELSAGSPRVAAIEVFTGVAADVAVDGDRLYVADADGAVRVYARSATADTLVGIHRLEVSP